MKKVLLSFAVVAALFANNANAATVQTKQATTQTQASEGPASIVQVEPAADGQAYVYIQGDDGVMYRTIETVDENLFSVGQRINVRQNVDAQGNVTITIEIWGIKITVSW